MKKLLLASLITLLAIGTACGQALEPEPVASDGIQVHGHWTVTVTNPDGTVDEVREFDNELTNTGKQMLSALLLGELSVANHSIAFGEQSNQNQWVCLEELPNKNQDNPDLSFYFRLVPALASRPVSESDLGTKLVIAADCTIANQSKSYVTIDTVMVLIGTNESFNANKGYSTAGTEKYIVYEEKIVPEKYMAYEEQVFDESYTTYEDQVVPEKYIVYEEQAVTENYIDSNGSTQTRTVTKLVPVEKTREKTVKVEVTKTRKATRLVAVEKTREKTVKVEVTKERAVAGYQWETYPSSSASGSGGIYLTSHQLIEPITLTGKQKMGVIVDISFS